VQCNSDYVRSIEAQTITGANPSVFETLANPDIWLRTKAFTISLTTDDLARATEANGGSQIPMLYIAVKTSDTQLRYRIIDVLRADHTDSIHPLAMGGSPIESELERIGARSPALPTEHDRRYLGLQRDFVRI
jgi:hypothetical protein